ncbi:MAG: hypothetical protein M1812_005093 [Candelaria pacifica]|nr:MAG: hypothetical protein M1812_005093 [Candelaria pacifica]
MSRSNPYRRTGETKETLSNLDKPEQSSVGSSGKADEIISWQGLESAIQQQAKVANEDRSPISINTNSQGIKRKGRPSAEDSFGEHNTHKATKVAIDSKSSLPTSHRGQAIEQADASVKEDRGPASAGLRKPVTSRTASATDISNIPAGDNPYAIRGRDRQSPPPTPVDREDQVESLNMNPERRAMLDRIERSESMRKSGSAINSPAMHSPSMSSPSFIQSSPPLSRRESRDGAETNWVPTGPRAIHKLNGSQQQSSRWEAKAKNLDRIDTRSASTRAAVPSSMDIDSQSTSKPGSVTRSGNETPISMTPATPALVGVSTASTSDHDQSQVDQLVSVLGNFSNHVTEMASRTYQRDIARKRQARLADEYTKNSKFHSTFRGLAEQQANSKLAAQNETERLDKKLKEQARNLDSIARAIVDGILSASSRSNNSYESSRSDTDTIRRLQNDVLETKALVKESKAAALESKIYLNEAKAENVELNRVLHANKKEIESLRKAIANVSNPYNRLKTLEDQVQLINTRPDGVSDVGLRVEMERVRKQATALAKRADDTSSSLRKLKATVEGDGGDEVKEGLLEVTNTLSKKADSTSSSLRKLEAFVHGEDVEGKESLLSLMVGTENTIEHFKGQLGQADEDLSGFHSNLIEFESKLRETDGRITTLEKSRTTTTPSKVEPLEGSLPSAGTNAPPNLENINNEVLEVKKSVGNVTADIAALRQEQEEKDDLVGGDIDSVRTSLVTLETEHQGTKEALDRSVVRIDTSIAALQSSLSAMAESVSQLSTPQTDPSATNKEMENINQMLATQQQTIHQNAQNLLQNTHSLDANRQSLDQHQQTLNQHYESLVVCETAYKQLDGRFNSLTTDQLTRKMVHQLQEMYPHASNTQASLEQARNRLAAVEQHMQEALTNIARLSSGTPHSGVMSTEEMN